MRWIRRLIAACLSIAVLAATGCLLQEDPASGEVSSSRLSSPRSAGRHLDVPYISQKDVLPTGCEIVSAVMLLHYYAIVISIDQFINNALDMDYLTERDGERYGPHPNDAFIGSPYDGSGMGCYVPVIARALERLSLPGFAVINTTGMSLDELCREYIDKERPVLIWATINLEPVVDGPSWLDKKTGEPFTWKRPEHCMVLTGYDDTSYTFNDPYNGNGLVSYPKALVRERHREMGSQSVSMLSSKLEVR